MKEILKMAKILCRRHLKSEAEKPLSA